MKAAVLKATRRVAVEDRPLPALRPDEVLVRIRASGICGSDVHGFEGRIFDRRPIGIIMGHEAAGEVHEVGAQVKEFSPGERVAINPLIPCLVCPPCRRGWFHLCDAMVTLGSAMRVFHDGTMCEFAPVPSRQLHRLPEAVSFEEGALVEPASNAVHLLGRVGVELGSVLAVVGTGAIGLIVVQAAKLAGAGKVIAVDINPFRLACAERAGADRIVNAAEEDPVAVIREESGGRGADVAVEAAGTAATYRICLEALAKRGKVAALGFMEPEVSFPMRTLVYREISVIGCTAFSCEIDTTLALIASGRLAVKPLITHTFPLDSVQEAYETAADPKSNSVKVVVRC
jgi:2-desacetyl-2-hydroxyethyl bacteriochlorophyllide A dehydrogenase